MLFVAGGSGNVGTALVAELRTRGIEFRRGNRRPQPAEQTFVEFDWERPETYGVALDGCDTAFLLTPVSPHDARYSRQFISSAKAAGVKRIVKLSLAGASPTGIAIQRRHFESELLLRESGLSWALIRPSGFMQCFTRYYGASPQRASKMYLPHGAGVSAWVDAKDVASVAAELLLSPERDGTVYDVTGPEAVDTSHVAQVLSQEWANTCSYVDVTEEVARAGMARAGMPERAIGELLEIHSLVRNSQLSEVSDAIPRLLNREARTLQQFAQDCSS